MYIKYNYKYLKLYEKLNNLNGRIWQCSGKIQQSFLTNPSKILSSFTFNKMNNKWQKEIAGDVIVDIWRLSDHCSFSNQFNSMLLNYPVSGLWWTNSTLGWFKTFLTALDTVIVVLIVYEIIKM